MITAAAVHEGFSAKPKHLSHAFMYDGVSYELFDSITSQEIYYIFHGDIEILTKAAKDVAEEVGKGAVLVEFGCGNCKKSMPCLEAMKELKTYIGVDIDERTVKEVKKNVQSKFPDVSVMATKLDVLAPFQLPTTAERNVGIFAGNMIPSFPFEEMVKMIKNCLDSLGDKGILLTTFDSNRDPVTTVESYKTPIYAKFVKNALSAVNNRFGAKIDLDQFDYCPEWNAAENQVDQNVRAVSRQEATIEGKQYVFEKDEKILIFESKKVTLDHVAEIAKAAKGTIKKTYYDKDNYMCLVWIEKA